jgi:transmembrane sensor
MTFDADSLVEAVSWFARAQSGRMTADEQATLDGWLAAAPQHREAFEAVAATWTGVEPARRDPAVMAARERARGAIRRRTLLTYATPLLAACLVAVAGAGIYYLAPGKSVLYATRVGQASTVGLPDGSRVVLDTDSALRAWPRRRGERRIELVRGRAHFEVAKDATRPFVVRTDRGSVTALGTKFDVRLQPDGMKVVLLEGRVRVQPPGPRARAMVMKAGEQIEAAGGTWRLGPSDTGVESSWLRGKLVVEEQPLTFVVDELNRYSARKIRIADPAVGRRRLSAVLDTGDSATFLRAVQELKLARVRPDADGLTLVAP